MNTVTVLLLTFVLSVTGLGIFIWSLRGNMVDEHPEAASVIFSAGEIGRVEDPSATSTQRAGLQKVMVEGGKVAIDHSLETRLQQELRDRIVADQSTAYVCFVFLTCAIVWLILASAFGLISSVKLHDPGFLSQYAWLTFGRTRTLHLNIVAYGWCPMAAFGIAIWMLPRLLKTPLYGGRFALLGCMLWNAGLIAGLGSIAVGINDGLEWLEIPWQISILLVAGGALIALPLVFTLANRKTSHLYVSIWYMGAALFWFPVLYLVGKLPAVHFGVEQATMNWW